jgi:hypothetical protein
VRTPLGLVAVTVALAVGGGAAAQGARGPQGAPPRAPAQPRRPCDGDTVTTILIRSHPPSATGLAAQVRNTTARMLGMPYTSTRYTVVDAYLRVSPGRVCSEVDRIESERLLRAQPFISAAAIQAIPDGPRHVRLEVDVVDEPRLVGAANVRGGDISSVTFGNENFMGRGMSLLVNARRGFAYRDGFGVRLAQYGLMGMPNYLAIDLRRYSVEGERFAIEVAEPFLTDLQHRAFHAGASQASSFHGVMRPDGQNISLFVRRSAYDVGWVTRLRRGSGRGTIGLVGLALLGEDTRARTDAVIISDTGFAPGPADGIGIPYGAFSATRVVAITGVRMLRFTTVRGFDALTAEQDMGVGTQFGFLAGPSVISSARSGDFFVATDLYGGFGHERSFLVAHALAEARSNRNSRSWNGVVASGRLTWYSKRSPENTSIVSVDAAAVQQLEFPLQLTFRDADGGVPGFGDATFAGGQRVVARVEDRRVVATFGQRFALGVAGFAAAGKLWAGDAPYGRTTPFHSSVGVSLLGAYPAGGKRTYRVDLAFPINPAEGGARFEVRFSGSDRSRLLWLEPRDVASGRTGAVPVGLMKW